MLPMNTPMIPRINQSDIWVIHEDTRRPHRHKRPKPASRDHLKEARETLDRMRNAMAHAIARDDEYAGILGEMRYHIQRDRDHTVM